MQPDIRQFNKRVLLTGAGFSSNWGGRLAREVWEEIFSYPGVQKRPSLRTLLLRTPMFEDALGQITDPKIFDDQDRSVMHLAIEEVFQRMDAEHAATLSRPAPKIDSGGGIMEFFARFYCQIHRVGYIFSLNQDALAERLAGMWVGVPFAVPGIQHLPSASPPPLSAPPPLVALAKPDLGNMRLDGNLNYIKLHGSFLWRQEDSSPGMVLGGGKQITIGRSPLLTAYHSLFERVLCAGDVRLFVIGYGFQDDHINKIIWTAAQSFNARIFVWDKQHPLQLLKDVPIPDPAYPRRTIDLRPYLCGAASRSMAEVFPWAGHPTAEYHRIVSSFF
jgi:hypothetical protein